MRALAALLVLAVAAQAVKLDFSSGLDGWVHSQDAKYASAKFVVDTPEPLKTQALKVSAERGRAAELLGHRLQRRDPSVPRTGTHPESSIGGSMNLGGALLGLA